MTTATVFIPVSLFLFAFVGFFLGLWRPKAAFYTALIGTAASVAAAVTGLIGVLSSGPAHHELGGWPRPFGIEYTLDELSGALAVLVTVFGFLATMYARRPVAQLYDRHLGYFYTLVLLLLAGLSGIVVTGDLFNLFVFLEIASLATYALVATGGARGTVAAFRYLIIGTLGGTLYLLGVGFLFFETGTLNMAQTAELLPSLVGERSVLVGAALIVTGLGLKAALFPLHIWLPDAYAYAPPPVSTLIAAIMTKVSAYAVIRLLFGVFGVSYAAGQTPITAWIVWLSVAGIVITSIQAIPQREFRRLLAYSSVAQLAYIVLGIGFATPLGLLSALLHIVNHAVMKGCLFMAAGSIQYVTGRERIDTFDGLGRAMPWTSAALVVGGLSLIGVPPTGGFFSKWYLIQAALTDGAWVAVIAIVAGSLLAAAYVFRVVNRIYFSPSPTGAAQTAGTASTSANTRREAPATMLVPTLVLAAAVIGLGLANSYIVDFVLEGAVQRLLVTG